jgi:general secretion pathway protein C
MSVPSVFERLHLRSLWWPRLVMACAALAIAWSAAQMLWLLLAGPTLPEPSAPDPQEFSLPAGSGHEVPLSQWHLFGQSSGMVDLAQLAAVAPETALRLFLKGTLNLDAPDGGIAIVADDQGHEQAYRVGDRLPGDAELIGVYASRVLLRRAGVEEGLSLLPDASGASVPAPASGAGRAGRPMPAVTPAGAQPVPTFVNPQIYAGAPSLETVRAATNTDVAELAKQVNVIPVLENGRFAGVRLSVGRDSDLLARSGLRTSDLITAVNGIPLDVQRQAELLATLRSARQFTVTIRRDGQSMDVPVGL